jgi:hypothetical protein
LVQRIAVAAAEARSFERAAIVMKQVGDQGVSPKTIARVVHDVGPELAERRDADPKTDEALAMRPASPPELAVVECDGGRIRTREPGHGPGVHSGTEGWRETKNAVLIRASRTVSIDDPQPEPPACFRDAEHVAQIAEAAALSVAPSSPGSAPNPRQEDGPELARPAQADDWRPKRPVRTVLAGIAESKVFGKQMERQAKRRRFFEAQAQAFLGDGLPWNWSIWKKHFADFAPILDFIPVLSYPFLAAKAVHEAPQDAWSQYLVWMRGAWRGGVAQVLEELRAWPTRRGVADKDTPESDPRQILATTINYPENNQDRMKYPAYRQAGLPVTTAGMESRVKEMNYRVKGTEMFWNDPEGAAAILQVRAASLCDDERLAKHPRGRAGCAFTRRPKSPKLNREKIRS